MILDLTNKLIKPITLIALISLVSTWAFGIYNVLVNEMTIDGITIKVVNLRLYLDNLQSAWSMQALDFSTILPTRTWDESAGFFNWEGLFNNLAFLFDWTYFPINFILYILRWLGWIFKLGLALIGWNIGTDINGNYYSQLVNILTWITKYLMIPYV